MNRSRREPDATHGPDTGTSSASAAALRIALVYAAVAAVWIVSSDALLGLLAPAVSWFVDVSISKGLAFVAITAGLLYVLIRRQLQALAGARARLAATNAALQTLNAELETRVRARTQELEALNRSLDSFVHTVSHDLKAPLRGIDGYSRLLQEGYADRLDEEGRLFVRNIRAGVERMQQLIDDLLAYSRLERKPLHEQVIRLPPLVQQCLHLYASQCAEQGIELHTDIPDIRVRADAEGLRAALCNLLDNAIKFTAGQPRPRIEVGAKLMGEEVCLWVRDNGIGFDMRHQERIFEIFQRLHTQEAYPGSGIGLAIVRRAVERMGGRVWAESAPGEGSTFHLCLPAHDDSGPPITSR
ncbi:MAG: HAMP domain-containing histidine kinase [Thiobacillaceae bacterium]|nr:HAMP domain-containing histidine kinase [Thiobacillaceae bacterium]MDW8322846.1 HAMP domain-containing sensor histidine kinase [Burkholderiales bacterium]